jgi:hypothetical protein
MFGVDNPQRLALAWLELLLAKPFFALDVRTSHSFQDKTASKILAWPD